MTRDARNVHFAKYHAPGNDYLVVEADELEGRLSAPFVRRICDRHVGIGPTTSW